MRKSVYEIIQESLSQGGLIGGLTGGLTGVLPDNGWVVLAQFCCIRDEFGKNVGLSVVDLNRRLWNYMHINTIRDMIKRLEKKALIRMYSNKGGKGFSKMYIITGDGLKLWEMYEKEVGERK